MKKLHILLSLFVLLFISSCDEVEPIPEREPITGAIVDVEVGGSNLPNQVYIDLSTNTSMAVTRDAWDLGFYSGEQFRVIINGSVKMAVKASSFSSIDEANLSDVESFLSEVAVGTFDAANIAFVDNVDGDLEQTAIEEIQVDNAQNPVYFVNMGYYVSDEPADLGTFIADGEHRGIYKIQIFREGETYKLLYARHDDNTHHEVIIPKNTDYNFSFYSLMNEVFVNVQPVKNAWDLCYSVFTNEFPGYGTYPYPDFFITNILDNTLVYSIEEDDLSPDFDEFTLEDVDENLFEASQRAIGSTWRVSGGPNNPPTVKENVFYIIKDPNGFYFKVKFTAITNSVGERGYPQFVFELLQ